MDDELDYIINNQRIINYAYLATNNARKYEIVQKFFKLLAYVFRFCYKHISKVNELFPHFILACTFMIELYNKEFHNIYLILFVCLLIKIKRDFLEYRNSRDIYYDGILSRYFYRNQTSYKEQRIYFYMKNNINISKSFDSENNNRLFRSLKDIIEYIFNDFKDKDDSSAVKKNKRINKGMYRRFWIILGFLLIGYKLLLINLLLLIFLLPLIIMIYTHYYTYYISKARLYKQNVDYEMREYKYNKKYNIIFWIFTILQGYIFWLLLLKPELMFMDTEILLRLPFKLGEYVRIYSIEEKIIYLFNYFEFYISLISDESINKNYLRYILRQINYKDLLDDIITLKDIQVYIKLLIDNYYFNEVIYHMLAEHINNKIIEEYNINPWYTLIRNILIISAITSTFLYGNNIILIVKQMGKPEGMHVLMKDIYTITIKNKLTYEMLVNIIMKIFKW